MRFLIIFIISFNAFADLKESKCFKEYQYNYNKKLLYNLYGDLNNSNTPVLELFEKQILEAATFDTNGITNDELFYPKLIKKAHEIYTSSSDIEIQKIIQQGIESGKFCEDSNLLKPHEVMGFISLQLGRKSTDSELEFSAESF